MNKFFDLEDGKYRVILNEKTSEISILRYGETWRSCLGDKLIYALVTEIMKAKRSCFQCPDCGYKVQYEEYVKGSDSEDDLDDFDWNPETHWESE